MRIEVVGLRHFMKRYSVKFILGQVCPAVILISAFAFCGTIILGYCLTDGYTLELYQNDVICLTVIVLLGTWDRKGPSYSSSLFSCSCRLYVIVIDMWSAVLKAAGPFPLTTLIRSLFQR